MTFEREIDTTERPSCSVVQAVCAVTGKNPVDAPPLADTVDPEGLNDLFQSRGDPEVTFTYDGHEVMVQQDTVLVLDAGNE